MLDFETSGFDSGNVPAQLAYQILDENGDTVHAHACFLVGPQELDSWVQKNAPHITVEKCDTEGEDLAAALKTMFATAGDHRCVVAHNAAFDFAIIAEHGGADATFQLLHSRLFCTMVSTRLYCAYVNWNGQCKNPTLFELAKRLQVSTETEVAHDASSDVSVTVECLRRLCCGEHDSIYSFKSPHHHADLHTYVESRRRHLPSNVQLGVVGPQEEGH